MRIIPNNAAGNTPVPSELSGIPAAWKSFLTRYDGGHLFPPHLRLAPSRYTEATGEGIVGVQYFYATTEIVEMMAENQTAPLWPADHFPVANITGGDELLMAPGGQIGIWLRSYGIPWGEPENDILEPVASSFTALLSALVFDAEWGAPPPWNRMASPDDPPSIPFQTG